MFSGDRPTEAKVRSLVAIARIAGRRETEFPKPIAMVMSLTRSLSRVFRVCWSQSGLKPLQELE